MSIEEPAIEQCEDCCGEGRIEVPVSRDMALDAGDVSLTGYPLSVRCDTCKGDGWVYA